MLPREELLDEAKGYISGDRDDLYGPPTQNFRRIAGMLNVLGFRGPGGGDITAYHVSWILMVLKMSRMVQTPFKRDHYADLAGYAACGYECVVEEEEARVEKPASRVRARWHRLIHRAR